MKRGGIKPKIPALLKPKIMDFNIRVWVCANNDSGFEFQTQFDRSEDLKIIKDKIKEVIQEALVRLSSFGVRVDDINITIPKPITPQRSLIDHEFDSSKPPKYI